MERESELQTCQLELKYCERCGALWVRRSGGEESYCAGCAAYIEELPKPKPRGPRQLRLRRKRAGTNLQAAATESLPARGIAEASVLEKGRAR
jgi:hypothetical protein